MLKFPDRLYSLRVSPNDNIAREIMENITGTTNSKPMYYDLTKAKKLAVKTYMSIPYDCDVWVFCTDGIILEHMEFKLFTTKNKRFRFIQFTKKEWDIIEYGLLNNSNIIYKFIDYEKKSVYGIKNGNKGFFANNDNPNWNKPIDREIIRKTIQHTTFFNDVKISGKNELLEYYSAAIRLENRFHAKMNNFWMDGNIKID